MCAYCNARRILQCIQRLSGKRPLSVPPTQELSTLLSNVANGVHQPYSSKTGEPTLAWWLHMLELLSTGRSQSALGLAFLLHSCVRAFGSDQITHNPFSLRVKRAYQVLDVSIRTPDGLRPEGGEVFDVDNV